MLLSAHRDSVCVLCLCERVNPISQNNPENTCACTSTHRLLASLWIDCTPRTCTATAQPLHIPSSHSRSQLQTLTILLGRQLISHLAVIPHARVGWRATSASGRLSTAMAAASQHAQGNSLDLPPSCRGLSSRGSTQQLGIVHVTQRRTERGAEAAEDNDS